MHLFGCETEIDKNGACVRHYGWSLIIKPMSWRVWLRQNGGKEFRIYQLGPIVIEIWDYQPLKTDKLLHAACNR